MSLPSVRKYGVIGLMLLCSGFVFGFTPTGVAPAFFGPNALPVPDMSDGCAQSELKVELAADAYFSYDGVARQIFLHMRACPSLRDGQT